MVYGLKRQQYFDVHDCLSAVDGILVKGEVVVIPMALKPSIKRSLHSAHLGRDSCVEPEEQCIGPT